MEIGPADKQEVPLQEKDRLKDHAVADFDRTFRIANFANG